MDNRFRGNKSEEAKKNSHVMWKNGSAISGI